MLFVFAQVAREDGGCYGSFVEMLTKRRQDAGPTRFTWHHVNRITVVVVRDAPKEPAHAPATLIPSDCQHDNSKSRRSSSALP